MRHLDQALNAAIEATAAAVMARFDAAEDAQYAAREKGAGLRDRVAARELLGPALMGLASKLVDEVERRTTPRYEAALRHPRYGREALVNEADDAEVTINTLITSAAHPPTMAQTFDITIAAVRVRAITSALGPKCFTGPKSAKSDNGYPVPRRRPLSAADVDPEVAQLILEMGEAGHGWRGVLEKMRWLETTPANRAGTVSKIVALADLADGRAHVDHMVEQLKRAGVVRDVIAAEDDTPDTIGSSDVRLGRDAVTFPPRPAEPGSDQPPDLRVIRTALSSRELPRSAGERLSMAAIARKQLKQQRDGS
jgi:hypothetical protein